MNSQLSSAAPKPELRAETRRKFLPPVRVQMPVGMKSFPLVDISLGGLAFLSDAPMGEGKWVQVSPMAFSPIPLEVLRCEVSSEAGFKFRISGRFDKALDSTKISKMVETLKGMG
ncbi:MAG: PilZ domain-containing protein [Deltaproteobacteria bacterium]|nr:PilZ domain-containing protein [Deltaproteobacteria bacterium]